MHKDNISQSSYKTDTSTGLPVVYLRDTKKGLWEKFHEEFPNGMRRTAFMTRLEGGRFLYKENMGGLCNTCNECGYEVFDDIELLVDKYIANATDKV